MDARDIERVRLPLERAFGDVPKRAPRTPDAVRFALRQVGMPLTREIAPSVHACLELVTQRLGVTKPVELYQLAAFRQVPGYSTACFEDEAGGIAFVSLIGPLVDALDEAALRTVLGHELGHALAHTTHALGGPRASWLARELTADRFGMLAEPDVMASVRAQMSFAGGGHYASTRLDADAYAAWCVRTVQEALAQGGSFYGTTHPEHCVRVFAMVHFAQTDLFRELTGVGPGTASVDELNAVLERIVRIAATAARRVVEGGEAAAPPTADHPPKPADEEEPPPTAADIPMIANPLDLFTETLVDTKPVLDALGSFATRAATEARKSALDAAAWWVGRERPRASAPAAAREPVEELPAPLDPKKAELLARFAELERKLAEKERKG